MIRVRIPAPDIEADVTAEQVVTYLLARGWVNALNLSVHWHTFKLGLCTVNVPRTMFTSKPQRFVEAIAEIARAEGRHPSAVLADIIGPAAGVAGMVCDETAEQRVNEESETR